MSQTHPNFFMPNNSPLKKEKKNTTMKKYGTNAK
jgi:hypothetical protein